MIKINPNDVVDPRFLGIPYKLGGKDFSGADCMNVVLLWYAENGITFKFEASDAERFKKSWERSPQSFISTVLEYGRVVMFCDLQKFDFLLFFSETDSTFPTWPAVMVDDRHFILSIDKKESRLCMLDAFWKNRFWGGIRPKQVE